MLSFRVNDMTCGGCAGRIARSVASVDGAARVEASVAERLVRIESSAPATELARAIAAAGYTPEPVEAVAAPATGGCCCGSGRKAG